MATTIVPAKIVLQFRMENVTRDDWAAARPHFVMAVSAEPGIDEFLDPWDSLEIEIDEDTHEPVQHPRVKLEEQLGLVNARRKARNEPDLELAHDPEAVGQCIRVNGVHWCSYGYRLRKKNQGDLIYSHAGTGREVRIEMQLRWESQM